ncbi:hypothetical protein CXZ05_20765 [Arthrobacter sp. AFG20]|nr:hypothetical protein CXZ05_20765 [Arthrobacter sp. AFG20]
MLRQVHPSYFDGNEITEMAFYPGSSSRQCSCSRSTLQTAQGAYDHHTGKLELKSVGTCAVSVQEVVDAGSRAVDDSAVQTHVPPTPGHTYIDFRTLGKDERSFIRDDLAAAATARGFLYTP